MLMSKGLTEKAEGILTPREKREKRKQKGIFSPGCAVAATVAVGRIASVRVDSFRRPRRGSERVEERVDPGRLQQRKSHEKRFAMMVREPRSAESAAEWRYGVEWDHRSVVPFSNPSANRD